MNTVQNLFQQAQLAEAAYADFVTYTDPKAALKAGGFSDKQADGFLADWRFIDQYDNSAWGGLVGTGFSATLFKDIDTGEYSFAIRGSKGANDFIADAQLIATDGIAVQQVVDMYNYWTSLTTSSGSSYLAAKLNTQIAATTFLSILYAGSVAGVPDALSTLFGGATSIDSYDVARAVLIAGGYIIEGGNVYQLERGDSQILLSGSDIATGLGKLSSGASVNVDGHSLGGHLAMAFSRLFPGSTVDATGVNGLGFKIADPNVNSLFAQLGGASGFDAGKIQNVYGIAGPEFVAMNSGVLQQPGKWNGIYIESGGLGTIGGHSGSQMTDSLALYNLLATLDPSVNDANTSNLDKLTGILKACSNDAAKSLENTLDALRVMFTQYTTGSPDELISYTPYDNRQSLYTNLQTLQTTLANSPFNLNTGDPQHPQYAFVLHTLTEAAGSSDLATVAKTDLATRYALYAGNTFVLDAANDAHYEIERQVA